MRSVYKKRIFWILLGIFSVAVFLRFLYFPGNVYFGFDQARDAFASQSIFGGDLKIIGPPTANQIFHHGVLYYYIFGPIYLIFNGNPEAVSAFLRLFNASGVFLIFFIGETIFNPTVGIISAIFYAFSFEQTQLSLFLNHPAFVPVTVLVFYLGLALWIFKNKKEGFLLAVFGLGLSIQFEFVELQLIPIFLLFLLFFRKKLSGFSLKQFLLSGLAFLIPISTYIVGDLTHNFLSIRNFINAFNLGEAKGFTYTGSSFSDFNFVITRFLHDNFVANNIGAAVLSILLLVSLLIFLRMREYKSKMLFLSLWFFGGLLVYFLTKDKAYFYSNGTSLSLLVFGAFLVERLFLKSRIIASLVIILILFSNLFLITKNNPLGPNMAINPQKGLLLTQEMKALDYIYQEADGQKFAVNALTMPLYINTTWSYLFEWYGRQKYGYVPVWGGNVAAGYYGNLKVNNDRKALPYKRFLIIEPKDGIYPYLVDKFLREENYFTNVVGKKKIGTLEVWVQKPKE